MRIWRGCGRIGGMDTLNDRLGNAWRLPWRFWDYGNMVWSDGKVVGEELVIQVWIGVRAQQMVTEGLGLNGLRALENTIGGAIWSEIARRHIGGGVDDG